MKSGTIQICFFLIGTVFGAERPQIEVPYVTEGPVIDGDSSDWEAVKALGMGVSFYPDDGHAGSPTELGTTVCRKIDGPEDCRVELYLAHDGSFLYVLAEVFDDDHETFGPSNTSNMAYLEDTLHLYIDSTNARKACIAYPPIGTQPGYEQFGYSTDGNIWGENTDFTDRGAPRQPAPVGSRPDGDYWRAACRVSPSQGGYVYVFEEAIALSGRPGRNLRPLSPGERYGFDAEFCDADNGIQLEGFIWWSGDGVTDAWNYENLWGVMVLQPVEEPVLFVRGDSNADGAVDIADAVRVLMYLFAGAGGPSCLEGADTNGDGTVDIADAVSLLSYLMAGGPPPPAPFPDCGVPAGQTRLGCDSFEPCR